MEQCQAKTGKHPDIMAQPHSRPLPESAGAPPVLRGVIVCILAAVILFQPNAGARTLYAETPGSAPTPVIVLDPGHGGHDTGVTGPGGVMEKDIALLLARAAADRLGDDFTVFLTRTGDYNIDLPSRTAMANARKAAVFVSIHFGGSPGSQVDGWGVYHDLRESGPRDLSRADRSPFEWNRIQQLHIPDAAALAASIARRLEAGAAGAPVDVMGAPLPVLSGADMPAVLVEAGHLSHPPTESEYTREDFIRAVAGDIAAGIAAFLEGKNRGGLSP